MEDGIMDDGGLEGCIEEMRVLAKDKSPYLGIEFPSEEAAYEFYNEYGRIVGFGIRRDYCNKRKKDGVMTSRKLVCYLWKWIVSKFDNNYNHLLHLPQCTHLIPSQRKVCNAQSINIDIADDTRISFKPSHDLISVIAGGKEFVRFMRGGSECILTFKKTSKLAVW
ncbi:hypothetical protein ACSBR2_002295 [Camellia fascicularis]